MNENNQPQSQQTKRELTFKAGDLCMAWHYNQYDKVDLFYCRLESVGYEYATGELFYDEEMTRKAGRRKDICVADLMPWSEAGKANKQPSESSHSPTEQPGDAKPLIERLNDYARDYTNTTYHEALILEAVDQLERIHNHDELYMRYKNMSSYRDAALAERDRLLGEKSILQAKQAELLAEVERITSQSETWRKGFAALQESFITQSAELEQLRSERDKLKSDRDAWKGMIAPILDFAQQHGKTDNRPSNIQVMTKSEHSRHHQNFRKCKTAL